MEKKRMRNRMSKESLTTRFFNATQRIREGQSLQAAGERDIATIKQWAEEDGLLREFRALESPQPWVAPRWEATKRVRVVKAFCVSGRDPYGPTIFQGAIGAVVDLPLSIIRKVSDCVEVVPDSTELHHVYAPAMAPTD
jgi:hypothetical protein